MSPKLCNQKFLSLHSARTPFIHSLLSQYEKIQQSACVQKNIQLFFDPFIFSNFVMLFGFSDTANSLQKVDLSRRLHVAPSHVRTYLCIVDYVRSPSFRVILPSVCINRISLCKVKKTVIAAVRTLLLNVMFLTLRTYILHINLIKRHLSK